MNSQQDHKIEFQRWAQFASMIRQRTIYKLLSPLVQNQKLIDNVYNMIRNPVLFSGNVNNSNINYGGTNAIFGQNNRVNGCNNVVIGNNNAISANDSIIVGNKNILYTNSGQYVYGSGRKVFGYDLYYQ